MRRILYGVQATGSGHIMRLTELLPYLQELGDVTVLSSGLTAKSTHKLIHVPVIPKTGLYFLYRNGGLDYFKTFVKAKIARLIKDINELDVAAYDYIISDFEPITSWACKISDTPYISMGHQVAFASDKTPRPEKREYIPETIIRNYAPFSDKKIGFHFESYDDFIWQPPVRSEIKNAVVTDEGHYTVYLDAHKVKQITEVLSKFKSKWHVFTRETSHPYEIGAIKVFPCDKHTFLESFISSRGIICGAGFETPSEALHIGKKLLAIPIKGQYEQFCNAAALKKLGVMTSEEFNEGVVSKWMNTSPVQKTFSCDLREILKQFIK